MTTPFTKISSRCAWLLLLIAAFTLTACGGSSSGNNKQQETPEPPVISEPETPAEEPELPSEPKVSQSRYRFANACYQLASNDGRYISANNSKSGYELTDNPEHAANFYFKPTALGRYLLLSNYQRDEGQRGSKALLGITDPAQIFLDPAGNFVGEVGYLVSGLGDTLNLVLDPIAPLGKLVRGLGKIVSDTGDKLGNTSVAPRLGMVKSANDLAVWELNPVGSEHFSLASAVTGLLLSADDKGLGMISPSLANANSAFSVEPGTDCSAYPEAELNVEVADTGPAIYLKEVARFQDVDGISEQDIYGFVDTHSHISAYEFIGGRVNYGSPFHKFGVDHALDDCAVHHGPQGMTGLIEQLTSTPGPHETKGWPSYNYWPRNNSLQHHQSYYRWIERAHLAGMKVMVNHLVHNEVLCQINPQKQNDCDSMASIELQARRMHEMQDYIDAQHGGIGQGWFQIVTDPQQARQVISEGKMAVILGVETSQVLNCGENIGMPMCNREDIVRRLDRLYSAGVRSLFPVHKFDNALGGHLPDLSTGVGTGAILYVGNMLETFHPIEFETCDVEEDQLAAEASLTQPLSPQGIFEQLLYNLEYLADRFPAAPGALADADPRRGTDHLCNSRGLSELGFFLIEELMKRKMMIETDHISQKAARQILAITEGRNYPVINSHGDWGGSEAIRDLIAQQGGITASFASTRGNWVDELRNNGQRSRDANQLVGPFAGAGFASDVNGIAALAGNPGAAEEAATLYPFTSVDGRVTFEQQRTGDRAFSLYDGRGVAHYGLYPDQIADMIQNSDRPEEEVEEAINQLFTSAEAYLRMWERIETSRP